MDHLYGRPAWLWDCEFSVAGRTTVGLDDTGRTGKESLRGGRLHLYRPPDLPGRSGYAAPAGRAIRVRNTFRVGVQNRREIGAHLHRRIVEYGDRRPSRQGRQLRK